ncbi:MAG TPA: TIGR03790 family protein [Roseateles sp.]
MTLPASGLSAADLAVVVAEGDAVSEAAGAAYVAARGVPAANLIKVKVNTGSHTITATDFTLLKTDIEARLPAGIQAVLFAWGAPSRVYAACTMSITSAMTLGYDARWCSGTPVSSTNNCQPTAASPLYDSETRRPQADLQLRPAMLLSTTTLAAAQALINRGVAADASFPPGEGWLVRTTDSARSVRWTDFEPLPATWGSALKLNYVDNSAGPASADALSGKTGMLFYLTGLTQVANLSTLQFRPGALADALTSTGGALPNGGGPQMPITAWLDAGATATYGTVSEPCNFPQKFSRASVLIDHYWRGATAIEAYWKAVQWPGQGLMIGEPLAQPFRDTPSFAIVAGEYQIKTRSLRPGSRYTLQYRVGTTWTTLASFTGVRGQPLDGRSPLPPAEAVQIRWQGPCADDAASSCTLAQSS